MEDLKPFRPGHDGAWDWVAAAHLLRRAGFCATYAEIEAAIEAGPEKIVSRLVDDREESDRVKELDQLAEAVSRRESIDELRHWWLMRLVHTRRPLWARMSLFWHNHFATSNAKVNSPGYMAVQLNTIDTLGLGPFEALLLAISKDPAMIVWLDGDSNIKGRPNENFARELFELFALGVGNYTENDIREAARAFTGWHQRAGEYRFFPHDHDATPKTVFGKAGSYDGTEIVQLTVAHPACAKFLSIKLLREFLCPTPSDTLVEEFAAVLREKNMHIGESLRVLFLSRAMLSDRYRRVRIKSPAEFSIGIVRSLEMRIPSRVLADAVSQMGQRLLEPPSVKGWDGHRAWLNSSTMLVRLNIAQRVTRAGSEGTIDPSALRRRYTLTDHASVLEYCRKVALDGQIPEPVEAALADAPADADDAMREVLHTLLSSPEYQMA